MKKSLILVFITAAFSTSAFAESAKSVTVTEQGSAESSASTSHNPLTNNDTISNETVTKDGAGNKTSSRKYKIKRDRKTGEVLKESEENKQLDSTGKVIDKSATEYKAD